MRYQGSRERLILSGGIRLNLRRWKGEQVAFQYCRHVTADKFVRGSAHRLAQCE
jgi:hypothetical protein